MLAAVVPTRREYAQFADDRPPDAYSLAYLRVLTRANPKDDALRLIYVDHLRKLGRFEEALALLGRPPALGSLHKVDVENLRLELLLAQARSIPEGQAARRVGFGAVAEQLRIVGGLPQPVGQLKALAGLALELSDPGLAAKLYWQAADVSGDDRASLLASAARWLRASGDSSTASSVYELASNAESDSALARADRLQAVDTLESDDRACDAADLSARYATGDGGDAELLSRATTLAEECGRAQAARDYGRRLLALSADDAALIERQLYRELAAGDVHAALPLVGQLLREHPDDGRLHELEAHVAEWSGQPDLALDDWLWLLQRDRRQGSAP